MPNLDTKPLSCPKCGADVYRTDSTCLDCGAPLSRDPLVRQPLWYYKHDGQTIGPLSWAELHQAAITGQLLASDTVSEENRYPWSPARTVRGLFPPVPQPLQPQSIPQPQQPHRGVLILIAGILALLFCPPGGIVPWILSSKDLKRMRAGQMDPTGQGLTTAGRILGILAVFLAVLHMLFGLWIVTGYFRYG